MKNKKLIISLIAVVLIFGIGFGGMKFFAAQKELPPTKPVIPQTKYVKTIEVKNQDIPVIVTAFGRVGTAQPLDLTTEVAGIIEYGAIPLKAGQSFRKGDILFKIEQNTSILNLKSQKSSFFNLIAGILPDMKIDYSESFDQWQAYFQNLEIDETLPELPEIKTLKEKTFLASKNIFTTYYTIKSEEERMKKYTIRAPYNGSITEVLMEVGSFANNNSRVARIIRTDQLEIDLPVDLNQIKWVKEGARVNLSNESGATWNGTVKRIGSSVNPNTQSISVFIGIENSRENPAYDGLYLKSDIIGLPANDVVEIPRSALFDTNKVFLVKEDQLKSQPVSIEKWNEETVLVSGLQNGDQIVPEPIINARENMEVKILNPEV
ncbi:multidrug efflux RND transporter periplasmic adaptor subunit CmeA [soil metagenome]